MSRISHVLDTSAILAHYFNEPGAGIIEGLWSDESSRIAISTITITELKGRLRQEITDDAEAMNAADAYLCELTICLPVDRATAELAWQLRQATPHRLPLVDALIAATARAADAVLVHKDPHMSQIPAGLVRQLTLSGE
ncbi:MAG: PIN domain-containing protein [Spirochaetia bacterium]|jgi:predicted nucleic acid-binding protein